jgi:short-subunit dehydrogenase
MPRGFLAVVTGASTGIGYELAKYCAQDGFDLLIAADEDKVNQAADNLRVFGTNVTGINVDLATQEGVDKLVDALQGRPVDALLANAGRGLGRGFLDQDFDEARRVVNTNITGTIYLIHRVARQMRETGHGRILITGSIAGFMPGTYQAVYNGTKAFLDSFSFAIRHELKGSGVSVSCLMPGATETDFVERADMLDTKVGTAKKDDPAMVARQGFDAMMKGQGDVVTGWMNKLQSAIPLHALRHARRAASQDGGTGNGSKSELTQPARGGGTLRPQRWASPRSSN